MLIGNFYPHKDNVGTIEINESSVNAKYSGVVLGQENGEVTRYFANTVEELYEEFKKTVDKLNL